MTNSNLPHEPSDKPQAPLNPQSVDILPVAAQPAMTPVAENNQTPVEPLGKPKREGGILSFIITVIIAFALVQVINLFLFQSYRVVGESMFPTLHQGDLLIISKIGKTISRVNSDQFEPRRGEIIVFQSPKSDIQLVKRVIGLPGERVVVKDGSITIYNAKHPDGFNPDADTDYQGTLPVTSGNTDITIPDDHVFVSGDNRLGGNSLDSRNELGTIPEDLIVGTLAVRIWPLSSARFF